MASALEHQRVADSLILAVIGVDDVVTHLEAVVEAVDLGVHPLRARIGFRPFRRGLGPPLRDEGKAADSGGRSGLGGLAYSAALPSLWLANSSRAAKVAFSARGNPA
jgi:hypothetical protein